jgi:hypothetical protein
VARRARPDEPAIVTSEAHALARSGQAARAIDLLVQVLRWTGDDARARVAEWVESRAATR